MKIIGRSCDGDERCEEEDKEETQIDGGDDDDEEEEALSLCDLPVKEKQQPTRSVSATVVETEDFNFNHWRPPPSSPMLTADDLFFQGHMLPLRLSFSSENSQNNNISGNLWSRSESMDRNNMLRFRNGSSSSSSSRSHYSRSSSLSNNSISIPTNSKPRSSKNVFHSHPSPTPQIRSFSTSSHRSRSSSRWEFFRLGLLRTPGMELHDLKTRTSTTTTTTTTTHKTTASILGVVSCKRSVDTVPTTGSKNRIRSENVLKNNKKNNNKVEIREKEKEKEKEKERRVSHRRTFEWLKQLSHASFGEEQ